MSKKTLDPDPETDDFHNLISSSRGRGLPVRNVW